MKEPIPLRFYAYLLKLYPHDYQRAFGSQMFQTLRGSYREVLEQEERVGGIRFLFVKSKLYRAQPFVKDEYLLKLWLSIEGVCTTAISVGVYRGTRMSVQV